MIEHVWTVISSGVIVDHDTNNISIFNILEEISVPEDAIKSEAIGVLVEIVTLWVRSDLSKPEKGTSRIRLLAPNEEVLQTAESEIDLDKYERLRSRGLFQGLPYKGEGVYRFALDLKLSNKSGWKQVASIPLKVNIVKKAEQAGEREEVEDQV